MSGDAAPLGDLPLSEVVDRLAAVTPAPGGGSAAAMTCAAAGALVEMAAGFDGSAEASAIAGRAQGLRRRALALGEADLASYGPVLEALRRPAGSPGRAEAVAQALSTAAATPYEITEIAAELADLAARVTEAAGRHTLGDAAVAATLADAACRSAATLVALNLTGTEDERPARAAQYAADAGVACQRALTKAGSR